MEVIILAKKDSTARVLCKVKSKTEVQSICSRLSEKMGGEWVYVQDLKHTEAVSFVAAEVYAGFVKEKASFDYCGNLLLIK